MISNENHLLDEAQHEETNILQLIQHLKIELLIISFAIVVTRLSTGVFFVECNKFRTHICKHICTSHSLCLL